MPQLAGMMRPDDVAETVMFVLTRPRGHRILEVALRPVTEASSGRIMAGSCASTSPRVRKTSCRWPDDWFAFAVISSSTKFCQLTANGEV